jgi:predicted DNA-binding transcriptional regulator YafY
MRRADRLFRLVQQLRRRRVSTAAQLASALGVSVRTVYRDIQDLSLSGVPVFGEAGVGYALAKGFDLPPLMFTAEEVEALVLGARIVEAWGDPKLRKAAGDALGKALAVLPRPLRDSVPDAALFAPDFHVREQATRPLALLRRAVRQRLVVSFAYRDQKGAATVRSVHPLGLFFWGCAWSLGAWCTLREGFRNFRLDRMDDVATSGETFPVVRGRTLADFFRHYDEEEREP